MRGTEDFIIAGILPKARLGNNGIFSFLDYVLQQNIDETYFAGTHQRLFRAAVAANVLQTTIDDEILVSLISQQDPPATKEETFQCQIAFRDLAQVEVTREKLKVLIPSYREIVHAHRMAMALEEAATVLTSGLKVDGNIEQGYKAARTHVMNRLSELDRRETGMLPTKEIRETAGELLDEYAQAKKGLAPGIMTGFREIDQLTNGFQKSELAVFCAFTGEGKTQLMLNIAWNAATLQKKNVAFISLEMPLAQVRRRIISRHTNHSRFGLPGGLEYNKIKKGTLEAHEELLYRNVIADWQMNPDYGKLTVLQLSKHDTVKVLNEKLMYLRSQHAIDMLVLDYASLLTASRRRSDRREEIVEVIENLKELCLTFNEGEGLCCVTANQISRKAREQAEEQKRYGVDFASETSAIEKNADFLAWLLRLDEFKVQREVLVGVAKYRDGDVGKEFRLMEHYESSFLGDLNTGSTPWNQAA